MRTLCKIFLGLSLLGLLMLGPMPKAALAFDVNNPNGNSSSPCSNLPSGTTSSYCSETAGQGKNGIDGIIKVTVNIISIISGIAAVIIIIVAGIQFVTSGDDPKATEDARNMIIYALVGVMVVVIAQTLSYFVINILKK